MRKFELMAFHDGYNTTDYVAPVDQYENAAEFVKAVEREYEVSINPEEVTIDFVRFFPKPPENLELEFPDGCYTFCREARGAIKVYRFDVS